MPTDTATSLNDLAALLEANGQHAKALPLYERALGIREAQLGPNHPDTATSLNNLAMLHHAIRATCEYDDTRTCSCMSPYPHTRRSLTACG